ncbi:hypothetical protein AG1IA_10155 [Rhizoctonia solani AG-1 IA]|uniref:Uncharacterized protein n=1 Tax=Thanatephorus cucumeris (strain AG1-IA) TaxID=983506 RepID=L8WCZ7_THACA|nr:hypothetical protein AG1IA_10155 [Rhizoctonia solani AG-1 IA]
MKRFYHASIKVPRAKSLNDLYNWVSDDSFGNTILPERPFLGAENDTSVGVSCSYRDRVMYEMLGCPRIVE